MGWLGNRLMRGASNRSAQRLTTEFGPGVGTGILALALGHACYPEATYGDNGDQDEIVAGLRSFPRSRAMPSRPADSWSNGFTSARFQHATYLFSCGTATLIRS